MEGEEGEAVVSFQREKGEMREYKRVKPPFPLAQEEIKTCVVTREDAFILVFL